jgi:MFS family permease
MSAVAARPSPMQIMRVPNVRRYIVGQAVSYTGTFAQGFSQILLVLKLSNNPRTVPIMVAIQMVPLLILGSWGGTVADRFDNRKLLLASNIVSALLAGSLGLLVQLERVNVVIVTVFAVLLGIVGVVDRPCSQAILSEVCPPDRITEAVGLNSMVPPFARLAGPALASLLGAFLGLAASFWFNGLSYLVLIVALLRLDRSALFERRKAARQKGLVKEGFLYARHDRIVGPALAVLFGVGLAGFNFTTALPLMSKFIYGLDPASSADNGRFALVQAVSAVGSLIAGVLVAKFATPTLRVMAISAVVFGVSLVALGQAPNYWWWLVIAFPVGVLATWFTSLTTSILQTSSRPDMLGRVMALFSIGFMGTTPIGALMVAWLAEAFSARAPFTVGGIFTALSGLVLLAAQRSQPQGKPQ